MKLHVLAAALIVSVAMAMPADAASKKHKKGKKAAHRAPIGTVYSRPGADPYEVYVGGELVGRDPDPAIRAYMRRVPNIWDGPE